MVFFFFFLFAWVKIKTYNWMELLPSSMLVLASLTMKVYYPLLSPISIHACFKKMSRILGSLLSKYRAEVLPTECRDPER